MHRRIIGIGLTVLCLTAAGGVAYCAYFRAVPTVWGIVDTLGRTFVDLRGGRNPGLTRIDRTETSVEFEGPSRSELERADPRYHRGDRWTTFIGDGRVHIVAATCTRAETPTGFVYTLRERYYFRLSAMWLISGLAHGAAAWPAFAIRSRHRRRQFELIGRCGVCRYDLRGLPEPRCPECGTAFDAARIPARTAGTHQTSCGT